MLPWANIDTSKGEREMKDFFCTHLPRRGCKKNDSILSSFLGGQGGGLGDVAHVTDPGQTNGQGPVLFF